MESAGQIPSPTTRIHLGVPYPTSTPLPPGHTPGITPLPNCDRIQLKYDVALAVISGVCFVFGVLYCFFGYRFFKATMFLTGFIFGSLVTYLICLEENLLPLGGKIGVSLTAGVLCGLITMLVQYVGLFMSGFHLGLLLAIATLIVMKQFYEPSTKWIPIGILFGTGLLFALLILYFQKSLTILGTSIFGAALMTVALDYFVEMFILVRYAWDRIRADPGPGVCWFSWLIMALWPAAMLVGLITQAKVTSKGCDHREAIHSRRRRRKVNLQRERERHQQQLRYGNQPVSTSPVWCGTIHSKYRHLYQIRRVNGDVIAQIKVVNTSWDDTLPGSVREIIQSYIQNIQHKLSPALQSLTMGNTDDEAVDQSQFSS